MRLPVQNINTSEILNEHPVDVLFLIHQMTSQHIYISEKELCRKDKKVMKCFDEYFFEINRRLTVY